MLPVGRLIFLPRDTCPACYASVFGDLVVLLAAGECGRGGWAEYRCVCGAEFCIWWPGVGEAIRKARAYLWEEKRRG